ncbi:MAG: hypothetical protein Q7W54_03820 [Bacteroidota bacterium]|nr:hypothetical protein [Bacteroidota bacterium]
MTARYVNPGLASTQTTGETLYLIHCKLTLSHLIIQLIGLVKRQLRFHSILVVWAEVPPNTLQTGIITYNLKEICTTTTLVANRVNPVCVGNEVVLTATVTAGEVISGGTIEILDGSDAVVASASVTSEVHSVQYAFTPGVAGDASFSAKYIPVTGFSSSDASVKVDAEDCCGCEETFTYVDNGNNSYTFTYTPAENMTDAPLVFTFAQGVAVTGLGGWTTDGATRQKTMDLVACQTYTWTVTLTPDCSGKSNNSNVWTDFKVNNSSKKGSLTNIVISCP